MALTHSTSIHNTLADAVVDAIDGGTGAGTLEFQTSDNVEVATLTFSSTAFGAASSGVATAASITPDTNATGGTVTKFRIKDGDGTEILNGTAGDAGSEDIVLSSATIGAGDTVSCGSMTYTASA